MKNKKAHQSFIIGIIIGISIFVIISLIIDYSKYKSEEESCSFVGGAGVFENCGCEEYLEKAIFECSCEDWGSKILKR